MHVRKRAYGSQRQRATLSHLAFCPRLGVQPPHDRHYNACSKVHASRADAHQPTGTQIGQAVCRLRDERLQLRPCLSELSAQPLVGSHGLLALPPQSRHLRLHLSQLAFKLKITAVGAEAASNGMKTGMEGIGDGSRGLER
ncbi:hypothetical protein Vafri_14987 [Volvox africanus]|uniref:Uncharacterized protein n=1 Tax=Volvox africanus TaxID=51714 RepID=A0A8J4F7C1_9CHLO|nr:hypothetical protein Vafri_14987 [Volvox africanus]